MDARKVHDLGLHLIEQGYKTEGRRLTAIARTLLAVGEEQVDQQVTTNEPSEEPEQDLASLVKDESDTILTLLKSIDATDQLRKQIRSLYDQTRGLQQTIRGIGKGLYDALGTEETKELDQSTVGTLKSAFDNSARDLEPLLGYASVLRSLESKIRDQDTLGPVQHSLPRKSPRELQQTTIRPEARKR